MPIFKCNKCQGVTKVDDAYCPQCGIEFEELPEEGKPTLGMHDSLSDAKKVFRDDIEKRIAKVTSKATAKKFVDELPRKGSYTYKDWDKVLAKWDKEKKEGSETRWRVSLALQGLTDSTSLSDARRSVHGNLQDFIAELQTWPKFAKKIRGDKNQKITTKNNGAFRNIYKWWVRGKYDEDMETLIQELNQIMKPVKVKSLKDLLEYIISRDSQKWRLSELVKEAMNKSKLSGSKLDKVVKAYINVDIESNGTHQEDFMKFQKVMESELAKEGIMSMTNKARFWHMKFHVVDTSSVTFTSDQKTINAIKRELPKLDKELKRKFKTNGEKWNKGKFIDKPSEWEADITGAVGITIYPYGALLDFNEDENKFVQYVRDWAVKIAKKYKMDLENLKK